MFVVLIFCVILVTKSLHCWYQKTWWSAFFKKKGSVRGLKFALRIHSCRITQHIMSFVDNFFFPKTADVEHTDVRKKTHTNIVDFLKYNYKKLYWREQQINFVFQNGILCPKLLFFWILLIWCNLYVANEKVTFKIKRDPIWFFVQRILI